MEGKKTLETVWTMIPIILVIIIAVTTTIATFDLASEAGSNEDDAINIDVTGKAFGWHFDYNDGDIQTSQDMYIPVGKEVYRHVLSDDLIHSSGVHSISRQMDVIPDNEQTLDK